MYLTRAIEYAVQTGRAQSASFKWLFPLTGFRAFESGIDCRILSIIAVNARLCLLRHDLPLPSLVSEVPWFFDMLLLRASQLSSPAQKRVMCVPRAAIDFGFS